MNDVRALRHPERAGRPENPPSRKPPWIRVRAPTSGTYGDTRRLMRELRLHTVCEEAACPNIGECWSRRHVTVMILGDICTRACAFCNVRTGKPGALDADEPRRLAASVARLQLAHVVVTSVDRDDLDDGGAGQFVRCIEAIRATSPGTTIEVLTPDFRGKPGALEAVIDAAPDVYNHNLETVPRLYPTIRPGARYFHSLRLLDEVKRRDPARFTKSGIMVGLGEARGEVLQVMDDLALGGRGLPDHRPVPGADAPPRSGRALRRTPGVRGIPANRPRQGVPAGVVIAPDPVVLPRRFGLRPPPPGPLGRDVAPGSMPTHAEKRVLPHAPEQMFELVADVGRYPEFLPWCVGCRVKKRQGNEIIADLMIGYKVFREKFTSRVVLDRPLRIDVEYFEGPFKYLNNHWIFEPHGTGQCRIDFYVDFEFRSRLMQTVIVKVFNEAVRRMVAAFEKRARQLYG